MEKPRNGRLIVDKDGQRREIYLDNSLVNYATSNVPEERFGVFLRKSGVFISQDLEEILKNKPFSTQIGQHLIELGFIDERLLIDILRYQTKEIFVRTFSLFEVDYRWQEGVKNPNPGFSANLKLISLFMEALRRVDNLREVIFITKGFPSVTGRFLFMLPYLSEKEYAVYQAIKAGEELNPEKFRLTQEKLHRILFTLLALGLIKIEKEKDEVSELLKIYEKVDSVDYYTLLGIERNASEQAIKDAYFALSKKFHPDRFASKGEKEKEMASKVFAAITKAYNILINPETRKAYEKELEKEKIPQKAKEDPEQKFRAGKKFFSQGKYEEAAYLFDAALRIKTNYSYMLWLGKALARIPRRAKEAEEKLLKASEMAPWDVEPLIELAQLYYRAGLKHRALSMIEKALSIDPEDVRVLKLKEKLQPSTKKKSFFDFFKK